MNTLIGNVEKLKSPKEIDEEALAAEPAVPAGPEE
jgi:hypothetical protein